MVFYVHSSRTTSGDSTPREALGAYVCESLVANRRHEWDEYCTHVEFELERYLARGRLPHVRY